MLHICNNIWTRSVPLAHSYDNDSGVLVQLTFVLSVEQVAGFHSCQKQTYPSIRLEGERREKALDEKDREIQGDSDRLVLVEHNSYIIKEGMFEWWNTVALDKPRKAGGTN